MTWNLSLIFRVLKFSTGKLVRKCIQLQTCIIDQIEVLGCVSHKARRSHKEVGVVEREQLLSQTGIHDSRLSEGQKYDAYGQACQRCCHTFPYIP